MAKTLLSNVPLPQIANLFLNNNPIVNTGTRTPGQKQGVYTIKTDWNKSDKLRFSGLFSRQYLGDCSVCQGPLPGPIGEAFQEWLAQQGGWLAHYAHAISITVVVIGISFFSLILGELVPKRIALSLS